MIGGVKPIVQISMRLRVRLPRRQRMTRPGVVFGTVLMVGLSAMVAQGDQPEGHSVLQRQFVVRAEPFVLPGTETESSARFAPVAAPVSRRLAQSQQTPTLPQPELLPPSIATAPAGHEWDSGIKPMTQLGIDIKPPVNLDSSGNPLPLPKDFASDVFRSQPAFPRNPAPSGPWISDVAYGPPLNFCYRPLYFEEPNLERYGRTAGLLQPLVSAGTFYRNVAILPFQIVAQRPGYCTYHDHHFRPGAPAPCERQALDFRLDAATVQAATVTGLIFLML